MSMKKKMLIAGACVLAALCGAGIWFAPQIRSVASIAQGAVMDEEARAQMAEENRRLEEELRDKYDVPQGEVNEEINAGVLDGSLSLEEAARQWLERNGQMELPAGETGVVGNPSDSGTTEEAPSESGSGAGVTPSDSGTAVEENPSNGGTAVEENPSNGGTAVKENPSNGGTAVEENPSNGGTTVGVAPSGSGVGVEVTPSNGGTGATDTAQTQNNQKTAEQKATEQKAAEQKAAEQKAAEEAAAKSDKEAKIQNLIAQAQVLRSVFTARLDGVIAECVGEFMALPPEQQTTSSKVRIVTARLGQVADMEKECDAQVASIVSQLQELDPDTASAVQDQYEREKLAKKTSLINEYRNGSPQ